MNPNCHDLRARVIRLFLFSCVCFLLSISLSAQEENLKYKVKDRNFKISPTPKSNFSFGGAIWLRGVALPYLSETTANERGFYIDQFRLSLSGDYGIQDSTKLTFSSQVRFFSYQTLIHHMWVGIDFKNNQDLKFGITQVPFGTLPGSTNSFWYSLGYYVGLEDDRDAGIKYNLRRNGWNFTLAYFINEEFNNSQALNRFAPDLIRMGEQQNEERNQGNIRLVKTFTTSDRRSMELGISGEIGQIKNRTTGDNGLRWKGAVHYVGKYGDWEPKLQLSRYSYDPANPAGVDDRLVNMGFFGDTRLVASQANVLNASIKRTFKINKWLFNEFDVYLDYSRVFKDESAFADSELINPGAVLEAGPFYIWLDFMWGKNAWYFNDSSDNSGPGRGSINPNKYEFRQNLSLEWFF